MATKVLTTSQLTFVDITDQKKLSAYLTSNLTTVQTYNSSATNPYNPSWESTNLVITPQIFIDQTQLNLANELAAQTLSINWMVKDGNNTEVDLRSNNGETVSGGVLTVSQNNLGTSISGMLTYICYVRYTDPDTQQPINIQDQMTYTLIRAAENAKTCSISGPQVFKYDQNGNLTSSPQITLTATVRNVNVTKWQYYNAAATTADKYVDYPITSGVNTINTGATLNVSNSERVFDSSGVAKIKVLTSDPNVYDIITITKIYDGQKGDAGNTGYTVLLTNESHIFPGTVNTAQASTASTQVIAFQGSTTKTPTITKVANVTSASFNAYGGHSTGYTGLTFKVSGTTITFTTTTSLTTSSGSVPIEVSVDGNTYKKMFSWSVAYTGTGACSLHIEASSQIFKSSDGSTYTPTTITLTPHVQNLTLSSAVWKYSTSGGTANSWNDLSVQSAFTNPLSENTTTKVLTIPRNCSLFSDTVTSIVLKCEITNGTGESAVTYADTVTIARLSDGQSAEAAYTVILGNEMQNIATNQYLYPATNQTFTCPVTVFEGTTPLAAINPKNDNGQDVEPTNGQFKIILPETSPAGINLGYKTTDQVRDYGTVTFSVATNQVITASGEIPLEIHVESDDVIITKTISYAASKSGSNGTSPVTFMLWAPNGDVFSNQTGTLPLQAQAYYGATDITNSSAASYEWHKYTSTGYQKITNTDGTDYTNSYYNVKGSEVVNIQTYKCVMDYGEKEYSAVYTMADMSDTYLSEMLTIGGTTFKNRQGGSAVYVIVRSNGIEKDPFPAGCSIGSTAPSDPANGTYWWQVSSNSVTLKKYNGTSWQPTTDDPQQFDYTWSLMDKDGNADTTFGTNGTKTGKVIYLSCSNIKSIGTLQCDVSTKATTTTS